MKIIAHLLLLILPLILSAQQDDQPQDLFGKFYIEAQLGLIFTGDYFAGQGQLGVGYRFHERHSLGITSTGFTQGTTSTNRSATGWGLTYRYQVKRWLFDAGGGYVPRFKYTDDSPYVQEILHDQSDPWYFRVGIHRHLKSLFTLGISYAQSGPFSVRVTDNEVTPPSSHIDNRFGPQVFTINLGLLLQ